MFFLLRISSSHLHVSLNLIEEIVEFVIMFCLTQYVLYNGMISCSEMQYVSFDPKLRCACCNCHLVHFVTLIDLEILSCSNKTCKIH